MTKYHFNSLLSGVITAQLISFLHVFQYNPHCSIVCTFFGAAFISLTAGVSVSVSSVCLLSICIRFFNFTLLYFSFWLILSLLLMITGEGCFTSAYTIVIPFVVFSVFHYLSSSISQNIQPKQIIQNIQSKQIINNTQSKPIINNIKSNHKFSTIMVMVITILITGIFYYFNCDKDVFLRIRDYLILAGKQGEFINDFYYKYTPYAVEAIKPSSYKVMRFLSLIGLTAILPAILYSTIFLLNFCSIDFIIKRVATYKTVDIKTINISAVIAGIINILIALFIFYRLYPLYTIYIPLINTTKTIWSTKTMFYHQEDYRIRVEGLRKLCKNDVVSTKNRDNRNKDNIWNYPEFIATMIKQNNPTYKINGNIVEKYWLANAFGAAKNLEALPYLEKLLDDPSINVQCAAIQAVGAILNAIPTGQIGKNKIDKSRYFYIIHLLEKKRDGSNVLYVQKSACNALNRVKKH